MKFKGFSTFLYRLAAEFYLGHFVPHLRKAPNRRVDDYIFICKGENSCPDLCGRVYFDGWAFGRKN
jgi:hypothetical protein